MLKWIKAALVAATVLCAQASAQVWSLTPSSWSGLTHNTAYNAASLGMNTVTANPTFKTWLGAGETEPTGGQYATKGSSLGFIIVPDSQAVQFVSSADGTVFGGTTNAFTGYATVSVDVMFYCSDPASLTQTNDSTIADLCIGASDAYRAQFKLVNHTGVNYPQRKGIKIYAQPTSSVAKITALGNANTIEPELEFNKVYTITLQVLAGDGAPNGHYRIWVDRTLHSQKTAHNTNATLGALSNRIRLVSYSAAGYSSGPTIECRMLPRASIYNDSSWFTALGNPTVASNTGTTRVFQTSFTPLTSESYGGFPYTFTQVTGTPTLAGTAYGTVSIVNARTRFVPTASAGDVFRLSTIDQLDTLETDAYGNQFVAWVSEYVPTGSAVWGIRDGADSSSYAISVNFKDGLLREGSTAGSGTVLMSLNPAHRYGIIFSGNNTLRDCRVHAINLTDEYRRASLISTARLSTAWPTNKGVASAVYTVGATVPEPSTVIAGRTYGLMAGDSYGTTYTGALGSITIHVTGSSTDSPSGTLTETGTGAVGTITSETVTSGTGTITATITGTAPFQGGGALTYGGGGSGTGSSYGFTLAGAMVTTRNNVGFHVAHGAENHFIPNAWRPGKPVNTSIPDVTYQWSVGRSGLRIEDSDSTIAAMGDLRGVCELVPCFGVNSANGGSTTLAGDTAPTKLAAWGVAARKMRDTFLSADAGNTLIWPSPVYFHSTGVMGQIGMEEFLAGCQGELFANSPLQGSVVGKMYSFGAYPFSYAYSVGGDGLHIGTDTEGGRLFVSHLFGNPCSSGFGSGRLYRVK